MNNVQINRFASTPVNVDMSRSRFERPFRHLTSGDAGKLLPIGCWEVLPGDTVKMDCSALIRMATPAFPVMDDAYLDIHFYFVPNRLVWEHWKEFCGESSSAWAQSVTRTIPKLVIPQYYGDASTQSQKGFAKGTVADYLGVPIKVGGTANTSNPGFSWVNALPFRAYAKIWNDWWRDENIQDEVAIPVTDSAVQGYNIGMCPENGTPNSTYSFTKYSAYCNAGYQSGGFLGGAPLPVCKLHDAFTSCLPAPQCGPAVTLPLGTSAPVVQADWADTSHAFSPQFRTTLNQKITSTIDLGASPSGSGAEARLTSGDGTAQGLTTATYMNLRADLSSATAATVNALRQAFALQRWYEKLALGGHRYIELVKTMFGVTSPDARLQRSEFLGGKRIPISMTAVAQTSAQTNGGTTIGVLGAYSQTADKDYYFTKSFTEHGYLMAVCCIRTNRTYQQGLAPMFTRQTLTDFYWPSFAFIGEQPVLKKNIYFQATSTDDQVFGYQEAFYDYRYSPNRVSASLRSSFSQTLDKWHYADFYTAAPTLSPGWIREPQENVFRTLADQTGDQFIMDFFFQGVWTRVMPLYSVPGLIDHH